MEALAAAVLGEEERLPRDPEALRQHLEAKVELRRLRDRVRKTFLKIQIQVREKLAQAGYGDRLAFSPERIVVEWQVTAFHVTSLWSWWSAQGSGSGSAVPNGSLAADCLEEIATRRPKSVAQRTLVLTIWDMQGLLARHYREHILPVAALRSGAAAAAAAVVADATAPPSPLLVRRR
jgi:hypothetical protein